ncbi:hypothetical protein [Mucilaginibacter sp. BT774]|uniref:hypothetical protein n=1 Tax=Mucilaginibacter sp. BT774 TaxID=3062276 RepID=UPI0026763BDC|nr:hypothetical protein [Mucilaginibacter sp. BT774]MDO3624693.1 hypothetical protein [Mucilaginibacter sp. BT774]
MKKTLILISLIFFLLSSLSFAQDKKVAVVTFYVNKKINVGEFGVTAAIAVDKLSDDPNFKMEPLLTKYHTQFFESYSKSFPFQLLPEDQVVNNEAYKAFVPVGVASSGALDINKFAVVSPGYKVLLEKLAFHQNEKNMLKIFSQADGVMDVSIAFKLVKIGFGGMGVVKVEAQSNIALFNKSGDLVFSIDESGRSKGVSPMVAGAPVMTSEKILPMCESAMDDLMAELQKDMPKMVKKADKKL